MSAEYHSFLICFHPGHTDVYSNGLPLGVIKDGAFQPHMLKRPDGSEYPVAVPHSLTNKVIGAVAKIQDVEDAAIRAHVAKL